MAESTSSKAALVAEDLLLLLFDPRSGTIAGEGTLFYTLAGALVAELAIHGHVEIDDRPALFGPKVRAVEPGPRVAVLAALLSASGSLPMLHRDIPSSGDVYTRGKELERGDWGAAAAGEAVLRTVLATTLSNVAAVTAVNLGR